MGNTLRPIELDIALLPGQPIGDYVATLTAALRRLRDERAAYFDRRRRENARWANGARRWLALMGAAAVLLTALASAIRLFHGVTPPAQPWDLYALGAALALYAGIAAAAFYEQTTDRTSSYFRNLAIQLVVRDLWTRFEFEAVKALLAAPPDKELREQLRALAQGFVADLDKAASGELAEWRADFVASLAELDAAAKRGTESTPASVREAVAAYETAVQEAAVSLVLTGDWEGEAIVSVNDKTVAYTRLRTVSLDRLVPGIAKIAVRARKGAETREGAILVQLKLGIQEIALQLE